MSTDNGYKIRDVVKRILNGDESSTANDMIDELFGKPKFSITTGFAADTAATAYLTPFTILPTAGPKFQLVTARYLPGVAITANGTNYATFNVLYDDAAGGGNTTMATANTSAVSAVAETPYTITVTAANAVAPAGSQLMVQKAVSGTGVVVGPGCFFLSGAWVA